MLRNIRCLIGVTIVLHSLGLLLRVSARGETARSLQLPVYFGLAPTTTLLSLSLSLSRSLSLPLSVARSSLSARLLPPPTAALLLIDDPFLFRVRAAAKIILIDR